MPAGAQQIAQKKELPLGRTPGKGGFSIAIINIQYIIDKSLAQKSIAPQIKKLQQAYRRDLRGLTAEKNRLVKELLGQRAILAPEVFEQRKKDIERKLGTERDALRKRKLIIKNLIKQAIDRIGRVLYQITKELAEERSIGMVFTQPAVYYPAKRFNITGLALKRLNERLPSINVKNPEKK